MPFITSSLSPFYCPLTHTFHTFASSSDTTEYSFTSTRERFFFRFGFLLLLFLTAMLNLTRQATVFNALPPPCNACLSRKSLFFSSSTSRHPLNLTLLGGGLAQWRRGGWGDGLGLQCRGVGQTAEETRDARRGLSQSHEEVAKRKEKTEPSFCWLNLYSYNLFFLKQS